MTRTCWSRRGAGRRIILFGGKQSLGTRSVEFQSKGYALGDFDGDGRTDAAGVESGDWSGKVVLEEGIGADGSVASTRTALTVDDGVAVLQRVQAVDIDNDGKDDLLVRTGCSDEPDCDSTQLYLSTGTGFTHTPIAAAPGIYLSHSSVTVGSANGDAYPDLVFTRQPTGMDSDLDFPSKRGAVAVVYVWLFKGSRTGPVTKGSVSFGESSLGVKPSAVCFGHWLG